MSLLSIVQFAARQCRFNSIPTSALSSTDPDVQQMVAFAQNAGDELQERAGWRNLKLEFNVIGDGVSTLYTLPADWQRLCPSDKSPIGALISLARPTIPLIGPVNDEWLNQMKALPAFPAYPVWRLIGGNIEIWPALANAEVVQSWYFSNAWISNASITARQQTWQADTDFSLIHERIIQWYCVWNWKASKGLDYAEDFRRYEMTFDRQAGQEDTGRVISTSTAVINDDTFWPGQIGSGYVGP